MQVDTIKIKADNERGYRIINTSDFDAKAHQPYDADAKDIVGRKADDSEAALSAAQVADDGKLGQRRVISEASKSLDDMTTAELKAHAKANEIDLGDATRKDDIRAAIDKAGK